MTYYEKVSRYNPDTFEVEFTQFRYRTVDIYPDRLYADEQTSTLVLDPFKFEEAML